ncbi:MAG TPA: Tat pathway signal protein [Solibacterales bacterium]|nr:Tat pathway signal protein [Bryobacterales bacterium]
MRVCLLVVLAAHLAAAASPIAPLPRGAVELLPGPLRARFQANRDYLLSLPDHRLLFAYYKEAVIKIPTGVQPLGGWEAPQIDLRGHFLGHFLSAGARIYAATGDPEMKAKCDRIVAELARCQRANGNGYVGSVPEKVLGVLESGRHSDVWAPYYTLHKTLMGLYEMWRLAGSEQALHVIEGMAGYIEKRLAALPEPVMRKSLEVEHGGMAELFWDLHSATGQERYRPLARKFEHAAILEPLARGEDALSGLHANTQIPKIHGAFRAYEITGEPRYRAIAENFFRMVAERRSYATGGNSAREFWGDAGKLHDTLGESNQETCTSYNMMVLARMLFTATGDVRYADFHERNLYNGILSAHNPEDSQFCYFTPMKTGLSKTFGRPLDSFWCCYGTGVQALAELPAAIYFEDARGLYVNLFVPSRAAWKNGDVSLTQETGFPEESSTRLSLRLKRPLRFALRMRVPFWAREGAKVTVNGAPFNAEAAAGSYLTLEREWKDGDRVEARLPMSLWTEPLPGAPEKVSVLYGPLVLAGLAFSETVLKGDPKAPATWLAEAPVAERVPGPRVPKQTNWLPEYIDWPRPPLPTWRTKSGPPMQFVPLYLVQTQPYGLYFEVRP